MITIEEFKSSYCNLCENPNCTSIDDDNIDDDFRLSICENYKNHFPYGENTTICGEDGCDGCFLKYHGDIELCKRIAENGWG